MLHYKIMYDDYWLILDFLIPRAVGHQNNIAENQERNQYKLHWLYPCHIRTVQLLSYPCLTRNCSAYACQAKFTKKGDCEAASLMIFIYCKRSWAFSGYF